jgi:hypothetical protein
MKLHNATILCLSLMSPMLSLGCVAPTDEDIGGEDSDAIEESELGTTSSALLAGGVDLDAQCKRQYGPTAYATLTQPAYSAWAAYAWRCTVPNPYGSAQGAIDVDGACRAQYGSTAFGRAADPNNAYSWQCWTPTVCDWDSDGCSSPPEPTYASKFHDACVGHDRCYATPGASKASCDTAFKDATYATCNYWDVACKAASSAFYDGVKYFGQAAYDHDQQAVAQCTIIRDHGAVYWVR